MSDMRYALMLSIWRTLVPYAVGSVGTYAASRGFDIDEAAIESSLVLSFGTLYYAAARFLEQNHGRRWGWLLGSAKPPTYPSAKQRKRNGKKKGTV